MESHSIAASAAAPIALDSQALDRLWQAEGLVLTPEQRALLDRLRNWFARRAGHPLADYLSGRPVERMPEITKELTAEVLARFRPPSQGVKVLGLLTRLIDYGNAHGIVSLCPPPIAIVTRRQPSPFAAERWPKIGLATQLRSLLADALSRSPPKSDVPATQARIELGRVFLSAIVYGGLLASATVEALVEALSRPEPPLRVVGQRVFVELSIRHKKQQDAEFRRWYPDPLTTCLLMRLAPDVLDTAHGGEPLSAQRIPRFVMRCIAAFLRHAHAEHVTPKSLAELFDAVRLDLESRIPIYLVHYASRSIVSHSLKPTAFRRIHGIAADPEPSPDRVGQGADEGKETLGPAGQDLQTDMDDPGDVEPRWLVSLREVLKGDDRREIIARLERLIGAPAPGFQRGEVGEVFAAFALSLFSRTGANKVKLAVATARAMVLAVAVRVGCLLGTSIDGFGSEEWSGVYEEALGDAESPGVRRKLARSLREFQGFLERERGAEPLIGREVFAIGDGLVPVDANVITEQEFIEIRERLAQSAIGGLPGIPAGDDGERLATIAWLILTLSFRCGLRRMEVLKLELDDLLLGDAAELLVRPTAARRLKTKSSMRRLPLHVLLEEDELDRLETWHRRRRAEEEKTPYSRFLFAIPKRNFVHVPQDGLFESLHRVMRAVTGDPTIRFHHLRHAFASRLYLMLSASALRCGERIGKALPGFERALAAADVLRERLLGHAGVTRRDLWAICSLLGHSSPAVSLEHYIHHLDLVLAEALNREGIAPEKRAVIQAAGAGKSQAYQHLKSKSLDEWVAWLTGKRFPACRLVARPSQGREGKATPLRQEMDADAPESLLRIWRLLFVASTSQRSIEDIAERHGIDIDRLRGYLNSALTLMRLKLSANGTRLRHRRMLWVPDKRRPQEKIPLACPVKPHEKRDRVVVERLAKAFRTAYRKSEENRKLLKETVYRFATESHPEFGGLIFREPVQPRAALDFLRCLELLGCKRDEIEFVSFDVTTPRSARAAAWRRALRLHSSIRFRKTAPLNGRKDWACPWLGIQPVFPDECGRLQGSAGFRFVMVMAAIAMRVMIEKGT